MTDRPGFPMTTKMKPPELSVITDVTDSYEILARASRQAGFPELAEGWGEQR